MEADFCLGQATQVWKSAEKGDFSVKILRCHQEAWSLPGFRALSCGEGTHECCQNLSE